MVLNKGILAATLLAGAALGFGVCGAAAAVVCDSDGDCWHAKETYTYPQTPMS